MQPTSVDLILKKIDEARAAWKFDEDPPVGAYPFGDFILEVTSHEINKGETSKRYTVMSNDGVVTMSYSWYDTDKSKGLLKHMTNPREFVVSGASGNEERKPMPPKSAIHDEDTREKIRLKCRNDWDLELTEDQVSMCIIEQEETGLSIFHNQLWPNSRKYKKTITDERGNKQKIDVNRITWDKTIDGYRAVAARTGLYAGVDAPVFRIEKINDADEMIASVTVYRYGPGGQRSAFVGEARYGEFVQLVNEWKDNRTTGKKVPNHVWAEKPNNQLAVAAERQALRRAFQSCEDGQEYTVIVPEPPVEPPQQLEKSRGREVSSEETGLESPRQTSQSIYNEESEPAGSKGEYVGIPRGGFKVFDKYNKEERIILVAKKYGRTVLALDSGQRVTVSDDGLEVDRRDRSDESEGGKKWKEGDSYFDGEKVMKVAGSKKDKFAIRLLLDSGFEVRLNRWGKEDRRKKREEKEPEPPVENEKKDSPDKERVPEEVKVDHDPSVGGEVVETTAAPPEAKAPGDNEEVDIDNIEDVAKLRQLATPLLKKYCETVLKRRVSPKEAYKELTGVVLNRGQNMLIDDYRILYQCLEEVMEEVPK